MIVASDVVNKDMMILWMRMVMIVASDVENKDMMIIINEDGDDSGKLCSEQGHDEIMNEDGYDSGK